MGSFGSLKRDMERASWRVGVAVAWPAGAVVGDRAARLQVIRLLILRRRSLARDAVGVLVSVRLDRRGIGGGRGRVVPRSRVPRLVDRPGAREAGGADPV